MLYRYLEIFNVDICIYIYVYIYVYIYIMSRTGTRKERPRERGLIWINQMAQSGSTEARSVGVLCIWQVEY